MLENKLLSNQKGKETSCSLIHDLEEEKNRHYQHFNWIN